MRTVLVREEDGIVAQPAFEAPEGYAAPDGYAAIQHATADLGDAYDSKSGNFTPYAAPAPSDDTLMARLRVDRDGRLAASDWTQLLDAPLTDKQRGAWQAYRKALRDLPKATKDPAQPEWPAIPA